MITLKAEKEIIEKYLTESSFLSSDEKVQNVEKPGEGNMNFTLRVITNSRTFILKQSRDYVEKYPQVAAPGQRVLREAEFYQLLLLKMKEFQEYINAHISTTWNQES